MRYFIVKAVRSEYYKHLVLVSEQNFCQDIPFCTKTYKLTSIWHSDLKNSTPISLDLFLETLSPDWQFVSSFEGPDPLPCSYILNHYPEVLL